MEERSDVVGNLAHRLLRVSSNKVNVGGICVASFQKTVSLLMWMIGHLVTKTWPDLKGGCMDISLSGETGKILQ